MMKLCLINHYELAWKLVNTINYDSIFKQSYIVLFITYILVLKTQADSTEASSRHHRTWMKTAHRCGCLWDPPKSSTHSLQCKHKNIQISRYVSDLVWNIVYLTKEWYKNGGKPGYNSITEFSYSENAKLCKFMYNSFLFEWKHFLIIFLFIS